PLVAVRGVPGDRARDPFLPRDERLPARLAGELRVADAERHDVGHARPQPIGRGDDLAAGRPVALLLADAQDPLRPVAHRDVAPLAVDVDVARDAVRRDGEVAADAVGAEAE